METRKTRLGSIDALRGAVMIVMALDHVRDFIHRDALLYQPTDLTRASAILFLTRWITHYCAPTFMFTAGLGAFLWWQRGRTRKELSVFLITRGLWLMALEVIVMRLAYNFTFAARYPIMLVVFWVLGLCMVVLAGLAWLPERVLLVLSLTVIALHNCLDGIQGGALWNLIHRPGTFRLAGFVVFVAYPLVPWVAVMAAGFCCGRLFLMPVQPRRRILASIGAAATLAFIVLRAVNVYGDPSPWTGSALSFLNCTKYPPSLEFLLMTLGPALLVLAWFDGMTFSASNPLIVFGRVPLFYFIAHFYLAHAVAAVLACLRYGSRALAFIFNPMPPMGPEKAFPPDFGYHLWVAYLVWILIVVALYPVCRWYAGVKARRRDWWLSYL
jgi:uncharacterized membrane protein